VAAGAALGASTAISALRRRSRRADRGQSNNHHQKVLHESSLLLNSIKSRSRVSEPTRTDGYTRGGGTGGRSDRDDEAAVSLENFSPRSEEKIRTDPEARNNESPTLQAEQHWESCDCSGSPPPQCPGSP